MTKAEKTRQFIIEKTAPLFNKKGFHGTSMTDITSATGLTKGSIYGNFRNKDELAIEAFRYNLYLLTYEVKSMIHTKGSAIEKLMVFIAFYKSNLISVFERGGCAILNTATDSDDNHPLLKEEVKSSLLNWKNTLEEIIEVGIKKEELKNIDKERFSSFFIALIEGSLFLSKTLNNTSFCRKNIEILEKEILNLKK